MRKGGNLSYIVHQYWESPCGILDLASIEEELVMADWVDGWHRAATLSRFHRLTKLDFKEGTSDVIEKTKKELEEYLAGKRKLFDLPLRLIGTPFQKRVWQELQKIPYGETISYWQIARNIDCKAFQAVGGAVGANPFSIIIPCHRVCGKDGGLTGYGGGLEAKKWLLAHERKHGPGK